MIGNASEPWGESLLPLYTSEPNISNRRRSLGTTECSDGSSFALGQRRCLICPRPIRVRRVRTVATIRT